MNRMVAALAAALLIPGLCAWAETAKISDITKDKVGQEVTVTGKASSFRASRSDRAPNSFKLKDASGEVRVAIWPDAYGSISGKEGLEKDGAQVTLTGEVAEYRGQVELHVKNGGTVKVSGGDGGTTGTAKAESVTTTTSH